MKINLRKKFLIEVVFPTFPVAYTASKVFFMIFITPFSLILPTHKKSQGPRNNSPIPSFYYKYNAKNYSASTNLILAASPSNTVKISLYCFSASRRVSEISTFPSPPLPTSLKSR